jgi:amino acid permease
MKVKAKEILIILLGIIGTWIFTIFSKYFQLINIENLSQNDILILLIIAVIAIIYVVYKRIGEIDKALENQEIKQKELEEKLKRTEQLIDIKADIKDLQRKIGDKNGKKK